MTRQGWWAAALLFVPIAAGCGRSTHMSAPSAVSNDGPTGQQQILVTARGFEPAAIAATAGVPCTLMVTRTTDMTCAKEFVMPMHGIRRSLPLGQPVQIVFTHTQPGEVPFACGMGMMGGSVMMR